MRKLVWIGLVVLFIFRYFSTQPDYVDGDRIRISQRITTEPVNYETAQYFKLAGLKIYLPKYPEVGYGDFIVIEGTVDNGTLKSLKLVQVVESKHFLYRLRKKIVSFYRRSLPEPHSSLIAGVTLGSKASIPRSFWENLKSSGTAHVVVASGMNVTLVAGFLVNALVLVFPRQKAIWLAMIGVWIYALISGFDAPIVRAAVMGSVGFSAVGLGRVNVAWRALFLSAAMMLIFKPGWIGDLGFILSFLATASLMLFESKIVRLVRFVPSMFREGLSTSLAAQIFVAPVIYATFGQFNLLSPIINGLVLWVIAPMTIVGMLAGIIGVIWFDLGRLILFLTYPLTSWFVGVVNLFS